MEDEELSFFIPILHNTNLPLFLLIVIHYVLVEISFRSVFGISKVLMNGVLLQMLLKHQFARM